MVRYASGRGILRFHAFAVVLGALAVVALVWVVPSGVDAYRSSSGALFFMAIALVTAAIPIRGTSGVTALNISPLPLLTLLLVFGTPAAVVAAAVSGVAATLVARTHRVGQDVLRAVLNASKKVLCVLLAGWVLWGVGSSGSGLSGLPGLGVFLRLFAAHGLYFATSTGLLGLGLWLRDGQDPKQVWQANFAWSTSVSWSNPLGAYLLGILYCSGAYALLGIVLGVAVLGVYVVRDHIKIATSFMHLVDALSLARDGSLPHLRGETPKVVALAVKLARRMRLSGRSVELVERAAALHNIGYISLDRETVLKPGRLSESEMGEIRLHPESGARILREVEGLEEVAEVVLTHHESVDGSGYPRGLRGEEIPVEAMVVKVAEAYIAMTHSRPHRPEPLSEDEALGIIAGEAGRSFDAAVVRHFLEMMGRSDLAAGIGRGVGRNVEGRVWRGIGRAKRRGVRLFPESRVARLAFVKGIVLVGVVGLVVVLMGGRMGLGAGRGGREWDWSLAGLFFVFLLGLGSMRPVRLPWGAYVSGSSAVVLVMSLLRGPLYAVIGGLGGL